MAFVAGEGATRAEARARARDLVARVRGEARPARLFRAGTPRGRTDRAAFVAAVASARRAIEEGEIFQVNLSHRFDARFEGRAVDLFAHLIALHPAPYATFVDAGEGRAVLSASPERFLRVIGRVAETDPMKGTRPRGATPREDRRLRLDLLDSEKEKAELAMIVDLSRNDLGRACRPGTVRVRVPRRLLGFEAVHQAIGVVAGRLAPDSTGWTSFRPRSPPAA